MSRKEVLLWTGGILCGLLAAVNIAFIYIGSRPMLSFFGALGPAFFATIWIQDANDLRRDRQKKEER